MRWVTASVTAPCADDGEEHVLFLLPRHTRGDVARAEIALRERALDADGPREP